MIEEWVKWEPSSNLEKIYYISSVSADDNGLVVILLEKDKKIIHKAIFKSKNLAYRYTNETLRAHLVQELNEKYGHAFYAQWIFFEIYNSSYLKWISKESGTISDFLDLRHFVIFDPNIALDIVVDADAEISFELLVQ